MATHWEPTCLLLTPAGHTPVLQSPGARAVLPNTPLAPRQSGMSTDGAGLLPVQMPLLQQALRPQHGGAVWPEGGLQLTSARPVSWGRQGP